ncbi:uncharacterized protein LOC129791089 isoform X2 [Lutzomyia longipalpis]|uniref:C2H2-type domain-containing protein n=2 Tax=Lutzomyia longipalpis TaxID=7200 RepID=A0A1B0C9U9_LUTLO|nr:uncharacterized protein LOC129791089 isoform X2 [Lutzomyia longipalpis]
MIESEELEVLCDLQIDDIFRDEDIVPIDGGSQEGDQSGILSAEDQGDVQALVEAVDLVPNIDEERIEEEKNEEPQAEQMPVLVEIPQETSDEQHAILPELSPLGNASSASSDSWSTTSSELKPKRAKRRCIPCNLTFKHHYDFFEHHRKHVAMPILRLKQLTQREIEFQEYLKKGRQQFLCARKKTSPHFVLKKPTVSATDGDGLKLKFKFHNVQMNNEEDQRINGIRDEFRRTMFEKKGEKILKASEIKQSPPGSPGLTNRAPRELIPIPELPNDLIPPDRIHFECPTLDGLDQFNSDTSSEDASDILKNLLEFNQQPPMMEPEWNGQVPNEFISIEKLGHVCRVCHMNFTDPVLLFQHQRQTGHELPPQGPSMPPHGPGQPYPMSQQHPQMPRMPGNPMYRPHDAMSYGPRIRDIHPPPPHHQGPGGQMALRLQQMRNGQFRPVMPVQFSNIRTRHPPPLYRVGSPQGMQPNAPAMSQLANRQQQMHMQPQTQQQPHMMGSNQAPGYRFAVSNGMMMNGGSIVMDHGYPQSQHMMGEAGQMQSPLMGPMYRGGRPVLPPRRHSIAPIGIRPSLGQFQPPAKKPRTDGMQPLGDGPMITMPPRAEGVPVIESVQSGPAVALPQPSECSTSKSSPTPSGQKSPKAVANILATRGITVTQSDLSKSKESVVNERVIEGGSKDKIPDDTDSVVQKLALNSSVSIISKKKTPVLTIDVTEEEMNASAPAASSPKTDVAKIPTLKPRHTTFLSCPEVHCQKKFLTEEALQRHTQKGHHSNIRFKCTKCSVMFPSSESLIIHQRRVHKTTRMPGEELGIPIVDLNNSQSRMKLLSMGIRNVIPLGNINKVSNGFFGLPLVCLKGAPNMALSNLQTIGADSVLSLGPIKSILPK